MLNTLVLFLFLRIRSDVAAWNVHFEHCSLLAWLILRYLIAGHVILNRVWLIVVLCIRGIVTDVALATSQDIASGTVQMHRQIETHGHHYRTYQFGHAVLARGAALHHHGNVSDQPIPVAWPR